MGVTTIRQKPHPHQVKSGGEHFFVEAVERTRYDERIRRRLTSLVVVMRAESTDCERD